MIVYVALLNMTTQPWHIIAVSTDFSECKEAIEYALSHPDYNGALIECWDAVTGQFEEGWEY